MRRHGWLLLLLPVLGCQESRPGSPSGPSASPSGQASNGAIRVFFTRPDGTPEQNQAIAKAVVGYIDATRQTLDVCAFELDNRIITQALVQAAQRGVRVRLVTETNYLDESGVKALQAVGVPVVDDRRDGALMHDKFMVFDGKAVWTGSMNFTENCAYKNNNNGIYLDDPRLAANYATKFQWMFEQHKFGGLPSRSARIPNPVVTLADGTVIENYFSTHDHIANRLIDKIGQAKTTIHFLAFSFTHKGIGRAVVDRARAGVEVQGVFEKSQAVSGYSEYNPFLGLRPQVEAYLDANPRNMHHKVLILDAETTVAGSFNFSDGADKQNDENVVILHNRDVAAAFEQEFQRVFTAAKAAEVPGTLVGRKK